MAFLVKSFSRKLEQIFGAGIYAKTAAFAKFFFECQFSHENPPFVIRNIALANAMGTVDRFLILIGKLTDDAPLSS